MENENFVEKLGSDFTRTASVKNLYGEPIRAGEKIIIPVAKIAYGFGGGFCQGMRKTELTSTEHGNALGEGTGGGGGISSKAKGIYEITPTATRFIPANAAKQIIMGIAIGFVLKTLLFSKRRRK